MTNSQKTRVIPAVGAALIAAGGTVWVMQQLQPVSIDKQHDDDRLVRLQATSSSTAVAAMIVKTNLRGEIFNHTSSLSRLHRQDVWVRAEESVTAVVIVRQEALTRREQAGCVIKINTKSFPAQIIVRVGEEKSATCRGSG